VKTHTDVGIEQGATLQVQGRRGPGGRGGGGIARAAAREGGGGQEGGGGRGHVVKTHTDRGIEHRHQSAGVLGCGCWEK
jgi:hypothetical protein